MFVALTNLSYLLLYFLRQPSSIINRKKEFTIGGLTLLITWDRDYRAESRSIIEDGQNHYKILETMNKMLWFKKKAYKRVWNDIKVSLLRLTFTTVVFNYYRWVKDGRSVICKDMFLEFNIYIFKVPNFLVLRFFNRWMTFN